MATKSDTSNVGLHGSLKPRKHYGSDQKKSRVRSVKVPGVGRFGFTRDKGEAGLFSSDLYSTNLGAILRAPDRSIRGVIQPGEILDEFDLGSGKVTNVGVTALANDSNWTAETTTPINTFNVMKFMNWGTGTAAAEPYNWKLQTQAENESGKKEAAAVTSSLLKWFAAGNAKLIITGTLECPTAKTYAITEWGLFSAAKTEGTALTANTSTTATELNDTAKFVEPGKTPSAAKARGAQQYIVAVPGEEPHEAYGLVLSNTETKAVVPGWTKGDVAELATTPTSTTAKYAFYPVMFDHRVFAPINVEAGNKIEFPYELLIQSGG